MAKPNFNKEFAATLLLEAILTTDEQACKKYGVTDRTLRNYRKRLATDQEFSAFFHTKKRIFDRAWAEAVSPALRSSLDTIRAITNKVKDDPTAWRNPEMLKAVSGAALVLAEVDFTGRMIDARLAEQDRTADGLFGEEPVTPDGEPGSLVH